MKEWLAAICGETWWRKKRERKMRWQAASRYPLPEREQLEQYAAAFFSLADLFQKLPCQKERFGDAELEQLLWQIQETACTGCARGMECWKRLKIVEMICLLQKRQHDFCSKTG